MAIASSIVIFLTSLNFTFGQLFRIKIGAIDFPFIDLCLITLALINLMRAFQEKRLTKISNRWFLYFIVYAWLNLVFNLVILHLNPVKPAFYLLRLSALLSLIVWPLKSPNRQNIIFLDLCLYANVIFGLIQYLVWPDFTYFNALNWDPHLYRLVSTFFDPTFTALIYLFVIFKVLLIPRKNVFHVLILVTTYLAFALTYSRAGYLCFLTGMAYYSVFRKNYKPFILGALIIGITILSLPRLPGEGTKLERTSSILAKIKNYKEGYALFTKSPLIGYGYNTIENIRIVNVPGSHANSGFDGSLMTVLVTTGLTGLVIFLLGLSALWKTSDSFHKLLLLIILVHSLTANSLFYPWILIYFSLTKSKYRT